MVLISSKLSIHPLSSALCRTGSLWQLRAQRGNQKFFSKAFPVIACVTAKVATLLLKITSFCRYLFSLVTLSSLLTSTVSKGPTLSTEHSPGFIRTPMSMMAVPSLSPTGALKSSGHLFKAGDNPAPPCQFIVHSSCFSSWFLVLLVKKSALTDTARLCTLAVVPSRPTEPVLHCKEYPVPHYWPDLDHLWNVHAHDTSSCRKRGPLAVAA